MKNKVMLLAILCSLFFMTGCATKNNTGAAFSPNMVTPKDNMGTVVFYRPPAELTIFTFLDLGLGDVGHAMQAWTISADSQRIALLGDNTFTIVELPPGKHKFNGQTPLIDTIENVEVFSDTVQYIKAFRTGYSFGTSLILKEVNTDTAQNELKGMKLHINPEKWKYK